MPKVKVYKPVEKTKPIYTGGGLKPPVYMPTYYEWLSVKGEQVNIVKSTAGTMFTVPLNSTLFITSAHLTAMETANASTHGIVGIAVEEKFIITVGVDHITGQHGGAGNQIINFSIPLKVMAGTVIELSELGITTPLMRSGFTGFLVKNQSIPTF